MGKIHGGRGAAQLGLAAAVRFGHPVHRRQHQVDDDILDAPYPRFVGRQERLEPVGVFLHRQLADLDVLSENPQKPGVAALDARHREDFALLQFAHAFEQATGVGRKRPPAA